MPIPDGARYTNSSRRQVRMSDGRVISRAAAENVFARGAGFRSNYELKRASAHAHREGVFDGPGYRSALAEAKERRAAGSDKQIWSGRTSEKELKALTAQLYTAPKDSHGGLKDRSPSGPLARWLTATGRRSPGKDYSVGETPTVK